MERLSSATALIVIFVLVVGCAPPGAGQSIANSEGPIKIGVLAPTTGNVAASGQDMLDGWNLFWKQHGTTVAGRQIEILHEDDTGNPDTALSKARLLVEQRDVDMLVGALLANTGLAVADYAKTNGTPYFVPVVSADDLTQRQRIPNVIRVAGWTSSQTTHPLGEWAAQQGYKRAATIANDYAFGHETIGGFVNTFTDNGGEITLQLWNPLNTSDFSPYLAQIQDARPDVVFVEQVGADSVRFVKQWSEFGLKGTIPLLGNETLVDQSLLRNMGPEAEGIESVGHFAEGRDSPETQAFVEAYDKEYGRMPSYYAVAMFTAGRWIAQAIEDVDGKVEDRDAFLAAVRKVELADTPLGPQKLDEYGNPILTVYQRKVVRREDGRLWNVVVDEFPDVSQFYKYDPEEFLKQPVYSRSYQGVK